MGILPAEASLRQRHTTHSDRRTRRLPVNDLAQRPARAAHVQRPLDLAAAAAAAAAETQSHATATPHPKPPQQAT